LKYTGMHMMNRHNRPAKPKALQTSRGRIAPEISLQRAADFLAERWNDKPEMAVVAGSGLGYVAEIIDTELEIPYADIPGFPSTGAPDHKGALILGRWNGRPVAVLSGRAHCYEGFSMQDIARPVQTLAWMGARALLATSAVGSVAPRLQPGMLTLVRDHINLVQDNPLIGRNIERLGPRYPDLLDAYSSSLRGVLQRKLREETGRELPEAVLAFLSGPCFETGAELKWLKAIGADLAGWSLVPEVIAAVHAGMKVLALSLVTDFSDPAVVDHIDADRIFAIGPSLKSDHLPVMKTALTVLASAVDQPDQANRVEP
jgi:purine-nucleoside phosphorylase